MYQRRLTDARTRTGDPFITREVAIARALDSDDRGLSPLARVLSRIGLFTK